MEKPFDGNGIPINLKIDEAQITKDPYYVMLNNVLKYT